MAMDLCEAMRETNFTRAFPLKRDLGLFTDCIKGLTALPPDVIVAAQRVLDVAQEWLPQLKDALIGGDTIVAKLQGQWGSVRRWYVGHVCAEESAQFFRMMARYAEIDVRTLGGVVVEDVEFLRGIWECEAFAASSDSPAIQGSLKHFLRISREDHQKKVEEIRTILAPQEEFHRVCLEHARAIDGEEAIPVQAPQSDMPEIPKYTVPVSSCLQMRDVFSKLEKLMQVQFLYLRGKRCQELVLKDPRVLLDEDDKKGIVRLVSYKDFLKIEEEELAREVFFALEKMLREPSECPEDLEEAIELFNARDRGEGDFQKWQQQRIERSLGSCRQLFPDLPVPTIERSTPSDGESLRLNSSAVIGKSKRSRSEPLLIQKRSVPIMGIVMFSVLAVVGLVFRAMHQEGLR